MTNYTGISTTLTKKYLEQIYIDEKKSMTDIAKICGCSRQYVHKQMKRYGVKARDKSEARIVVVERKAAENNQKKPKKS